MTNALGQLIPKRRVVVCVGSGGVGKTTTSAVLALHAAIEGRRALVMTIDPARRLANSLGVSGLDNEIRRIDLSPIRELGVEPRGELHATMLDMKRSFDALVERYAESPEQKQTILENRFYRYFSTSLAGAQELSASERLYEIVENGKYDLVVLDTPPTTNALDFLEAPIRFFDALDSAAFQWLSQRGRSLAKRGTAWMSLGTEVISKTLGKFTGTEFLSELGEFLQHFSGLFDGFRERTKATARLFSDPGTSFVIVTSPDPATVDEAMYFRERLDGFRVGVGAVVVNRVHKRFDASRLAAAPVQDVADAIEGIEGARLLSRPILVRLARKLLSNAHEFDRLAERDRDMVRDLGRAIGPSLPIVQVPLYATDVHSLAGLERLRRDLVGLEPLSDTVAPARPPRG